MSQPHKLEQVLALYRLGKMVRASLDLDATLAAIADAACELTGAELSAILLLDQDDQLVLRVGRGAVAQAVGERTPASAGIAGRALREGHPVLVPDMLTEPNRARPDLDARSGIRAYIAAPLVWNPEPLGVVTVAATRPDALGWADLALVQELAEHAAAAVAHARAYAREQSQRAETEALNQLLAEQANALQQLQRRIVQNEKLTAIGQLAHGIAHELNTPLGVIVSNLAVLQQYGDSLADFSRAGQDAVLRLRRNESPASVADALEKAANEADLAYIFDDLPQLTSDSTASADRIATIVRSLGTFAQRGQEAGSVSVEDALEAAITLAWNELKHRGQLVRDFRPVPQVVGTVPELTQVFVHLLLNAAQALGERGGAITLRTATEDEHVSVVVADNGCGIPPEHLPRIFEPFFTTHGPGQGTGMGLAVCHGIVSRFGGTIAVESERGRGTSVTVSLPLAAGRLEQRAA
jgi:signal transduction histidine kinase